MVNREVKSTKSYELFRFIDANRDVNEGHVNNLKKSIEEFGYYDHEPIVVNEKFEIIDGQNRFTACEELGLPIIYVMVEGLSIADARNMNIKRRNWSLEDYAKSYARSGDKSYQRFLELADEYELGYSQVVSCVTNGTHPRNFFTKFRAGEFTLDEEGVEIAKKNLDQLSSIMEVTGKMSKAMASAFIAAFNRVGYDHARMVKKLVLYGTMLQNFSGVKENLRQLEDLYNLRQTDETKLRFYN